jgi:adenylate cyclase
MKSRFANLRKHLLPSVACFALAWVLGQTSMFRQIENLTWDQRTKFRAWLVPTPPADDVAVIGIDEISLKELGQWPFNRELHGDFLQLLGLVKPGVVAWDVLFPEPTEQDEHFAKGMVGGGANVVLGAMGVPDGEGVGPTDPAATESQLQALPRVDGDRSRILSSPRMLLPVGALAKVAGLGFVDNPPGPDGVRRAVPLVVRIGDAVYPTLSLRSLMEYWQARPEDVHVRLGDAVVIEAPLAKRRIPIDETGAYLINYRYALEGSANYGYSAIYGGLFTQYVKKEPANVPSLTGKILFVGHAAEGLTDFGPTPFSPLTPLVLVHVNTVDNVLGEDYVRHPPAGLIWFGGILLGAFGLTQFSERRLPHQVTFALGVPFAYVLIAALLWTKGSWLMPTVGPVFGFGSLQIFMVGRRMLSEQRAKEQVKGMFGTYLSPALVSRMVASGEAPRLGGHEEDITSYFSDIQSYSTFSEKLSPARLVELLNTYLTACTDIIQEEGGTLDKYIGDAVVAMFGAPIALPDHAYRACVAALRVQLKLDELRREWDAAGDVWPEGVRKMRSRIGLNSGSAIIGNMGSRTRFSYTMTGDNVNLAARMESGAKSWGVYSMCTEATKLACEKHGGDRVVFRPLGRIVVQGRTQPVPVHELVGLKEAVSPTTRECLAIFAAGLESYYQRDWSVALAKFRESAPLEPSIPGREPGVHSNPSLIYQKIASECQQQPPPANWGGEFVMKEK